MKLKRGEKNMGCNSPPPGCATAIDLQYLYSDYRYSILIYLIMLNFKIALWNCKLIFRIIIRVDT